MSLKPGLLVLSDAFVETIGLSEGDLAIYNELELSMFAVSVHCRK